MPPGPLLCTCCPLQPALPCRPSILHVLHRPLCTCLPLQSVLPCRPSIVHVLHRSANLVPLWLLTLVSQCA